MTNDAELAKQLEIIENNPRFSEEKKLIFSKYRIQNCFENYYYAQLPQTNI